ncbi:MAG: ribosomal-protein-alanine N-acetyltransferase [Lachnospiraceae bacterium]|nr:ribosomal-protein-alanine N-acetyltransferase [Lachnospiraceae bacterium]
MMADNITIRMMDYNDIEEIFAIEAECFTEPWTKESFKYSVDTESDYSVVAVCDGRVCGYLMLRITYDSADIMNVAVAASYRKKGIAGLMMQDVIGYAKNKGVESFLLEVRESNAPAIGLYEKMGFKTIGRRKGYYTSPTEDALVMMNP